MKRPGFALATTIIIMGVSLISLTMLLMILGRSFKLTRSHADAILSFYSAEAGESYGMWKLSSLNNGADKTDLANCLAQNEQCPGGLDEEWTYALPGDATASFNVAVTSAGQEVGAAQINAAGKREAGSFVARRRTRIDAFKPIRQLTDNDQTFDYGIAVDGDFWTLLSGYTKLDTEADETFKAGIHANGNIYQFLNNKLEIDGPALAKNVIEMPHGPFGNTFTATSYRGSSCGSSGCTTAYSGLPTYCFGTSCEGYVGQIAMPGLDINSAQADSFKTIAREIEDQNPGKKIFYNGNELSTALDQARISGANDGWYTTDGPITYVNGNLVIDYGQKLRVPGVLVVQGKITMGIPQRFSPIKCLLPPGCVASTSLDITDATGLPGTAQAVTGLIATGDITLALYVDQFNFNGLMYTMKGVYFAGLVKTVETKGVIIARDYVSTDFSRTDVPMHHHTYDTSRLHLLVQGPRAIEDITTVYTGHWEEEY